MQTPYSKVQSELRLAPRTWLVTGAAGFIGSNLVEALLKLNQRVIGLDNFVTGCRQNLVEVQTAVTTEQWRNFRLYEGDIRNIEDCKIACAGADYVLHQAALGSVPRSLNDPVASHLTNVDGFMNVALASRDGNARLVYASSSSVYGDHPALPKIERAIGRQLSPYAATKYINELYADVFSRCYGLSSIGLRYFNVFGPRQTPDGPYAAVIPKWISALLNGRPVKINGDGSSSRDFCYVANVVQANILAATAKRDGAAVFNIAFGERTTLLQLLDSIISALSLDRSILPIPEFDVPRPGDVQHSLASIEAAREELGYLPEYSLRRGLNDSVGWYRGMGK